MRVVENYIVSLTSYVMQPQVAQSAVPSLAVCRKRWKLVELGMVELASSWEMVYS